MKRRCLFTIRLILSVILVSVPFTSLNAEWEKRIEINREITIINFFCDTIQEIIDLDVVFRSKGKKAFEKERKKSTCERFKLKAIPSKLSHVLTFDRKVGIVVTFKVTGIFLKDKDAEIMLPSRRTFYKHTWIECKFIKNADEVCVLI